MSEQITPRKRKAVAGETPSRSGGKGKVKGAPTPNPPLVPFPTPPRSRHRKAEYSEPEFPVASSSSITPLPDAKASKLPLHLQTLLTLHRAFNLALSLHLATHPPVLPPHAPSATSIQLPNLTNLLSIRETVERTGARRFGVTELQRLAWLWTWDGTSMPQERSAKDAADEDDNPFLVKSDSASSSKLEISGLNYIISPTRTLDPASGRKVYTYGLGIVLDLRPGETRQLLHGGAEGGLGNKGQGGGLGAVGRWSGAGEEREEIMRERLEKWVKLNGGYEDEPMPMTGLPTPANTRESVRSTIPPIPLLPLPHLPSSTLLPAANLFSSALASSAPSSSTLFSPKKTGTASKIGLADPFEMDEPAEKGKVARPGSVEERRQAMMDRIKARKTGKAPQQTIASQIANGPKYTLSRAETQEELKRRSTLSRLESVAEGVWMMFSAPTPGPSTLPTPPRGRRKAIPMSEAAEVIVKSSKTPISIAEAQSSLVLLTELCPFFLLLKTIAKQDWLEMPPQVAQAPISPSGSSLSSARLAANLFSPSRSSPKPHALPPAFSPSKGTPRISGFAVSTVDDGEVVQGQAIAGPASPGRVRRVGGLREVRERIRRELGE